MLGVGILTAFLYPPVALYDFYIWRFSLAYSVIEAMVAAPIVALGITHPEGHEAFGKGEHAL